MEFKRLNEEVAKLSEDVREIKYNNRQEIAVLEKTRKTFGNAL